VKAGHTFDFKTFNSLAIKKVEEKASKKGYAIIQQSALATISVGGNTKAMVGQRIDSTDWGNVAAVAKKFIKEKRKQVQVHVVYKYDSKAEESSDSSSGSPPPKKTKYDNSTDDDLVSDSDISLTSKR